MDIRAITQKTVAEKGISTSALARAINYSTPSLSQYLNGRYPAAVDKIEQALVAWLRREGVAVTPGDLSTVLVETAATTAVVNACVAAQEEGLIAVIIGQPGLGKSVGLKMWETRARAEGLRFLSVTANVATSSTALLRRIGEKLGITRGTASDLIDLIVDKLNREPSVLLIDEAQHLNARALDAVRAIHDATMTGVVFAGSLALSRTLDEGDGTTTELAQIQDRVAIIERLKPLSPLEVTRFYQRWTGTQLGDPQTLAAIRDACGGVPRKLVRLLTHCRKLSEGSGKAISAQLVAEARTRLVAAA